MLKDIRFWLIAAAAALIMLVNLGKRDFWDPDEPRYAQVAREMMERGDYFFMHINGAPYPDKPPMSFWATALVSKFTGEVDEFSARFFPAISGIVVVILGMLLADRMFGRRTALLTGIMLAASYTVISQSRWVHMDMPLTALMALMFFIMYVGSFERKRPWLWIFFFILAAIGILIKGPVGLLVPGFAGFVYLVFLNVSKLRNAKAWALALILCAFVGTILGGIGMLLFLVPCIIILALTGGFRPVATPWFAAGFVLLIALLLPCLIPMLMHAERDQPGMAYEVLVRQNIGRFSEVFSHPEASSAPAAEVKRVAHEVPHQEPFYYYYYAFPMIFLPWVLLLPAACAPLFRKNVIEAAERKKQLFLFALAVGVVLFFSFSSSKRELYAIPALMPAAVLVARFIENLIDGKNHLQWLRATKIAVSIFAAVVAVIAALLCVVILFPGVLYFVMRLFTIETETIEPYVNAALQYAAPLFVICLALLAAAVAALYALRKSRWALAFGCLAALSLTISGTAEFLVNPYIVDQYKSARPFTDESFAVIDGNPFVWYGGAREGVLWYSHRQIREILNTNGKDEDFDELAQYLTSNPGERKFILTTGKRWEKFQRENAKKHYVDMPLYEIGGKKVGAKELILISTQPEQDK